MKKVELKKPAPIRSTSLPWKHREGLPPENPYRKLYGVTAPPVEVSDDTTFVLVDLLVEDVKLSKSKARLAITKGRVSVNGEVVRNPDARVDAAAVVTYIAK